MKKQEKVQKKQKQTKEEEKLDLDSEKISKLPSKQHSILSDFQNYQSISSSILKKENCIHYSLIELSLKLTNGSIRGSNTRCIALLECIKKILRDYRAPNNDLISRDLDNKFNEVLKFMKKFTVLNDGIITAFKVLKFYLLNLKHNTSEYESKEFLLKNIDFFIEEKLIKAEEEIVQQGLVLIQPGDSIMVFGYSSAILNLFKKAYNLKKNFKIIVVDNYPFYEGKIMVEELSKHDIPCIYTLLGSVPKFLPKINKVFVGASSILINGYCISRVGTAMLGNLTYYYQKPFIVFCETYKFSNRTQLDSFSCNELANPNDLLHNKKQSNDFISINLRWDLTPIKFINMIVTEWGKFPATSVPVLLRELEKINYVGNPKK